MSQYETELPKSVPVKIQGRKPQGDSTIEEAKTIQSLAMKLAWYTRQVRMDLFAPVPGGASKFITFQGAASLKKVPKSI